MSKNVPLKKTKPSNPKRELPKSLELKNYPKSWYYCCWSLYACYCYAAFFPTGPVWGIHFIAYVPVAAKLVLLVAGGLLLLPGTQQSLYRKVAGLFGAQKEENKVRFLAPALIAIISFVLFRSVTINTDIYGDAVNMLKWYGDNTTFDWRWITDVFSPHLLDNKEALTVSLHRIVAYVFSISIEESYHTVSALCGSLFIFVWFVFLQKLSNGPLRFVLAILGMFSGGIQVFFGHVENYAFGILTSTLFLVSLYYYLEDEIGTLIFVLLYLLAFKAHIIAILFLPAVLVALAYHYRETLPMLQSLFTWRRILTVVIFPALAVGLALYVFVFHSWNEPYALSVGRQFQQTFLPIVSVPAPLDHYSLWSLYHLVDFLNILLLIAAPIVVLLATVLIFNRKDIVWSQPRVIVFGLAALFPFLFFVAMNPALSPVRDWDVYTLLVPPLLFFASMLLIQTGVGQYKPAWFAVSLVFGVLFTTVLIAVNFSPTALRPRLQDAGAYTYRSYYAGSDYIEARALVLADSTDDAHAHSASIITSLAKGSTSGRDGELAKMMSRLASFYAFIGNGDSAVIWATAASRTDTTVRSYVVDLAAYYVQTDKLAEGSRTVEAFLKNKADRNDTAHANDKELAAVMSQLGARYSRTGDDSLTIAWASRARKLEPRNLTYAYELTDYFMQSKRPLRALDVLHSIPPDSVSVQALIAMAQAAGSAYGPDSGLAYLRKAKAKEPNNASVDSWISQMKDQSPQKK